MVCRWLKLYKAKQKQCLGNFVHQNKECSKKKTKKNPTLFAIVYR